MGLNRILKLNFSKDRLMEIGARIGADVPFFILESTAMATGIGEKLEPLEIRPPLWFVLVNPGWEVSTRWAYEGLNFKLTKGLSILNFLRFSMILAKWPVSFTMT
jgi:4-diphosphocytidyl-2-C-methyl-D-erythritol kinase